MKLDHNEFLDMGPLSRVSTFNVTAQGIKKGSNSLVGWLVGWVGGWVGGWLKYGLKGGQSE